MSMTSSLSSTMIGHGKSDADRHRAVTQKFISEANSIQKHTSQLHFMRRDKHMQVMYPDTVTRLSSGNAASTAVSESKPKEPVLRDTTKQKMIMEKEFHDRNTANLKNEYMINSRKKQFNRSTGGTAAVHQILTGQSKDKSVEPIFPQNPTHQQVLMITGKLKMPDANKIPPAMPPRRRWLGDDKGWES